MDAFVSHSGKIAVLNDDNIDTDRIIPARFLSRVSRSGYGELLFADVRADSFPLDKADAKDATVLVVGCNFGCGSSREHAVWALQQAGFRAIVARKDPDVSGYSDIFRQNAANCGLLLIELVPAEHAAIASAGSGATVHLDLAEQTIGVGDKSFHFDISPASKEAILKGHDLIGTTLVFTDEISAYEREHGPYVPPVS